MPSIRAARALVLLLLAAMSLTVAAHAQSASEFAERARQVAAAGDHAEAAVLFGYAIEAAPGRRSEWLGAYADQLAFSGAAAAAIPLYREAAADPSIPPEERHGLERRLGFALLWGGRQEEAVPILRRVLASSPDDAEARDALAQALAARGREAAGEARAAAARATAETERVDPGREAALTRERAETLLYAGEGRRARAIFRELLERQDLAAGERQASLLGLARSYAWGGQPGEALPIYNRLIEEAPQSVPARIGRGQVLIDLGRHRLAQGDFQAAAALDPENREALRGLARADVALGRPRRGLERLAPLLDAEPEAATLLAAGSAYRAIGRPDRAEALARAAAAADPEAEGPVRMLEELMLQRAPVGTLELSHAWRSDGLRISALRSRAGVTFDAGLAEVAPTFRVRRFRGAGLPPVDVGSLGLFARRRFGDGLEAQTTVFLNIEHAPAGRDHALTHETSLSFLPRDRWRLGIRWNRRYADDNSLAVLRNLFADEIGAFAEFELDRDTRLAARAMASRITDGNLRVWGQLEASRRVVQGDHQVWLGGRGTAFAYRRPDEEGYWSPGTYGSIEATLQASGRIDEGWGYDFTGSLGHARSASGRGLTTGLRGQIRRQVSQRAAVSVFASHSASLAVTEAAGGFFGGLGATWQRTEIGAHLNVRF